MNLEETNSDQGNNSERQPHHVHLPGFITDEEVGLGDLIKRATSAIGIRPCGGVNSGLLHSAGGWLYLPGGGGSL